MTIARLALLSVHTSPLAPMGGKKTGGMNVYIRELAQELGQRGIAVDIFTRRSSADEPAIDTRLGAHVRVVYLTAGPVQPLAPEEQYPYLSEFTARLMAFATLRGMAYDIVYSHYWLSGWVAAKLQEAWGTPFVQMFHTLGQMKQRILPGAGVYLPDTRITTETDIMDKANRIIAATPAEHAQLIWLYRASKRRIEIVPPGVNTGRFFPLSRAAARAQTGFSADCQVLLFVGRIEPLKGLDSIVEALHLLRQQEPERLHKVCFAIIGGDPDDARDSEMRRLKALVAERGLADVVRFLGAKEQQVLPAYYAAASAVLMPSDYESFGMVALEAMASGTPVIASEVGGLAFLVRDNETGYHVPVREPARLADKISLLLRDTAKSEQMGQAAALLARDYAWSRIADRLLSLFDEVIAEQYAPRLSRRMS
jgi:D-inositol-3-phosphate glycosyltransferase